MTAPVREHPFDVLVRGDECDIRLAEAALLYALDHAPRLRPAPYLRRLDALAERVQRVGARTPAEQIQALQAVLHGEEDFRGNAADYYDPRNSLLHEVLDRRVGIPITLSALWIDIADQLGWPIFGVNLPGHFLVKHVGSDGDTLIDPFDGGAVRGREDCERIVARVAGRPVPLGERHLAAVGVKDILTRMLNNLRAIYWRRHLWYHTACVLDRLLAMHPDAEELHCERWQAGARMAEQN